LAPFVLSVFLGKMSVFAIEPVQASPQLAFFDCATEEAQFLDRLWKMASEPKPYLSEHRPGREPLSYITLVNMFDPNINTGVNAAEMAGDKVPFDR